MDIFRPTRHGGVTVRIEPGEAALLRSLVSQVMSLIATARPAPVDPSAGSAQELELDLAALLDDDTPAAAPEDPVLARLLPDGYRDDPDAASEFRRYTESSLRDAKQEAGQVMLDTLPPAGGKIRLSGDEARAWMRALNDIRLAYGTRLGVTEDFEEQLGELDPEDPKTPAFEVYGWLGAVQESLVEALA